MTKSNIPVSRFRAALSLVDVASMFSSGASEKNLTWEFSEI
jgi:hypothetical protein